MYRTCTVKTNWKNSMIQLVTHVSLSLQTTGCLVIRAEVAGFAKKFLTILDGRFMHVEWCSRRKKLTVK